MSKVRFEYNPAWDAYFEETKRLWREERIDFIAAAKQLGATPSKHLFFNAETGTVLLDSEVEKNPEWSEWYYQVNANYHDGRMSEELAARQAGDEPERFLELPSAYDENLIDAIRSQTAGKDLRSHGPVVIRGK